MDDCHFTYKKKCSKTTLSQGDVLLKTEKLTKLLEEHHAYYAREEYTHFQVLTQSCDLTRRDGVACSARYITLAAIRSLDEVVKRAIRDRTTEIFDIKGRMVCSSRYKSKLDDFLRKLFNNSEKNYFYLNKSVQHNFYEDSCTFLHLSIALKASEHYETCCEAKILELSDNFCARLGWMVGNLYSRVATEDYASGASYTKKEFVKLIDETLNKTVLWIPKHGYEDFKEILQAKKEGSIEITDGIFNEISDEVSAKVNERVNEKVDKLVSKLTDAASLEVAQIKGIRQFFLSDDGKKHLG